MPGWIPFHRSASDFASSFVLHLVSSAIVAVIIPSPIALSRLQPLMPTIATAQAPLDKFTGSFSNSLSSASLVVFITFEFSVVVLMVGTVTLAFSTIGSPTVWVDCSEGMFIYCSFVFYLVEVFVIHFLF